MERRELYSPRGYSSLHEFCTGHLKYSGAAASRRITAARCVKRYPRIAGMLLRGEINPSTLNLVADMLDKQNYREILSRIKGRSYREVSRLVARYRPQREIRDRVKPVYVKTELKVIPGSGGRGGDGAQRQGASGGPEKDGHKSTSDVGRAGPLESTGYGDIFGTFEKGAQSCVVLEEKYKLEFAVDVECMEMLERVGALLSSKQRKKPGFETLFKIVLRDYLDRHSPEGRVKRRAKRKKADKKPRTGKKSTNNSQQSRYIPQSIKDEVHTRDGGRCTYVGTGGRRCVKRDNLEVDHIVPFARGGRNTRDNLRLLCARHNMLEAERAYGKDHMKSFRRRE